MKALVLKDYHDLVYADVPDPTPSSDEVLVAVRACGICGSDVHGIDGSTGRRRPPVIMGHEAAGQIAAVGPDVEGWQPGDRVTFDSTVYCGRCRFCRQGRINLCDRRRVLGVSCEDYRRDGAFAQFVAVPRHILYRLPDALTFERAAMVEALSIAVHAVERTPVSLNDTAVVIGAGVIGLLIVQALRAAGCGRIVAVDVEPRKLELARRLGADEGIAAGPEACAGLDADLAFEAVGVSDAVDTAIRALRKGGALALIGNLAPRVDWPLQTVVTREITVYGSCASCGEYPACLDMIARGTIDVDALISSTAPLAAGASWFRRLYDKEPGLMKVVLQP